jgi:hypothetical protein
LDAVVADGSNRACNPVSDPIGVLARRLKENVPMGSSQSHHEQVHAQSDRWNCSAGIGSATSTVFVPVVTVTSHSRVSFSA